jgi:hypothetical protein
MQRAIKSSDNGGKRDLQTLFSSNAYRKQNTDFKWINLLMLYQGCRPSEAEKPVI